jgi:hypothetical protein
MQYYLYIKNTCKLNLQEHMQIKEAAANVLGSLFMVESRIGLDSADGREYK